MEITASRLLIVRLRHARNTPHHVISARSRKNLPVSVAGASLASHTIVAAPSSTERSALLPPMSVRTHPGQTELTEIFCAASDLANMIVAPLSANFERQ